MAKAKESVLVRDPKALRELQQAQALQEQAAKIETEIDRLLGPVKDRLGELVLERDRLLYEALAARQKFFDAAKKAHPELEEPRSVRYEVRGGKVYMSWDDSGPRFAAEEGAELPQLHAFSRRHPGRRAWDLIFWLR